MTLSSPDIEHYAAQFLWPLLRIGALFVALPVYSGQSVPLRVRVVLSVAVTSVVAPLLPAPPPMEMFSYQGILTAIQQLLIGLMAGFVLQLVFAAVNFAGQSVAYSMGLGFASLIDPQTGVQVPAVSQLYAIVTTLAFLVMDGHMVVIQMLVDSFGTIPIAGEGFSGDEFWTLLAWSGRLFAGGLLLALPAVTALLFVNLALGVATRAAPQLNIFSVGFPVTLLLGLWLLWLTLPHLLDRFSGLLGEGYELTGKLLRL